MYSSVMTADLSGVQARVIRVEADVNDGLPVFDMVGYLASAVKEARERVRIAVRNAGIRFPAKRITVNLSPANLRKEGTSFDLSIAISLLNAFGYLADEFVKDTMFIGELGLDGSVRGVKGVLAMIQEGIAQGIHRFVVPEINACFLSANPSTILNSTFTPFFSNNPFSCATYKGPYPTQVGSAIRNVGSSPAASCVFPVVLVSFVPEFPQAPREITVVNASNTAKIFFFIICSSFFLIK